MLPEMSRDPSHGVKLAARVGGEDVSRVPVKSNKFYYFTSSQHGLEAIRDKRLKIARISELNDPFEFAAVIGGPEFNRSSAEVKRQLNEKFGIICFSSDWHHPLMWSHYAAKHSGLALGFSIRNHSNQKSMMAVSYIEERPKNYFDMTASQDEKLEIMEKQLYSKAAYWKYEKEHRLVLGLEVLDPVTELYFHDYDAYLSLDEVIVGERCEVTKDRLSRIFADADVLAMTYDAKCSKSHFAMDRDHLELSP